MKKFVRAFNEVFVRVLLGVLYFFVVGASALLRMFLYKREVVSDSYWVNEKEEKPIDFNSPY